MCLCWYELKTRSELFWELWFRKDRIFSNCGVNATGQPRPGGRSHNLADPPGPLSPDAAREERWVSHSTGLSQEPSRRHWALPCGNSTGQTPGVAGSGPGPHAAQTQTQGCTRAPRQLQPLLRPLRSERRSSPHSDSQDTRESKSETKAAFGGMQHTPASSQNSFLFTSPTERGLQIRGVNVAGGSGPWGPGSAGVAEGTFRGTACCVACSSTKTLCPRRGASLAFFLPS